MAVFQPPPTWASPVVIDEKTKEGQFNPVWLQWFVNLVGVINSIGAASGTIQHNALSGLQGGTANQFFHLALQQFNRAQGGFGTPPSDIPVGGSPFTFQNGSAFFDATVIVSGGTVSNIEFSRDNVTFYSTGETAGMFDLSPGDRIRVTYSATPVMTLVIR